MLANHCVLNPYLCMYTVSFHICMHACPPMQFCSSDVVTAIQDPEGFDFLQALLESGANVNAPTQVNAVWNPEDNM